MVMGSIFGAIGHDGGTGMRERIPGKVNMGQRAQGWGEVRSYEIY